MADNRNFEWLHSNFSSWPFLNIAGTLYNAILSQHTEWACKHIRTESPQYMCTPHLNLHALSIQVDVWGAAAVAWQVRYLAAMLNDASTIPSHNNHTSMRWNNTCTEFFTTNGLLVINYILLIYCHASITYLKSKYLRYKHFLQLIIKLQNYLHIPTSNFYYQILSSGLKFEMAARTTKATSDENLQVPLVFQLNLPVALLFMPCDVRYMHHCDKSFMWRNSESNRLLWSNLDYSFLNCNHN